MEIKTILSETAHRAVRIFRVAQFERPHVSVVVVEIIRRLVSDSLFFISFRGCVKQPISSLLMIVMMTSIAA